MARKPREISASGIYHVMWRGIDRQSIFLDDADCIKFLSLCAAVLDEWFEILAFCLMGNHLHLLIKTKKDTAEEMEQAMKRLGIRYAQYFNRRYLRVGPVFQGRYKSVPVQTRNYFLRVLRYIHQNPVKANLCELPEEYLWSRLRIVQRPGREETGPDRAARHFALSRMHSQDPVFILSGSETLRSAGRVRLRNQGSGHKYRGGNDRGDSRGHHQDARASERAAGPSYRHKGRTDRRIKLIYE